MNIDIFTLFPEWFEWFAAQRHVSNLLATGSSLTCVNYRDHTPLSGGQVDDTPFGGGAGMVLRVDVVDSALRRHYGVDSVSLRAQRRVEMGERHAFVDILPGREIESQQRLRRKRVRRRMASRESQGGEMGQQAPAEHPS